MPVSQCLLVDRLSTVGAVNFQSLILTYANKSDSWKSRCLSKISVLLQMDSLIIAWGWILASFQLNLFSVWNTHMRQRGIPEKISLDKAEIAWTLTDPFPCLVSTIFFILLAFILAGCFFSPYQHTFLLQSRQTSLNRHWCITWCQPMVSRNQTCYLQDIRYPFNFKFIPFSVRFILCFNPFDGLWDLPSCWLAT